MSKLWPLIVGAGIGIALLRQASVLAFTPWESDFAHWLSIFVIFIICVALPLSFAWRRWGRGPDSWNAYRQSLGTGAHAGRYIALGIVVAVVIAGIFSLRGP